MNHMPFWAGPEMFLLPVKCIQVICDLERYCLEL